MTATYPTPPPLALATCRRFWAKVAVAGPKECWPWQGAKSKEGYGHMRLGGKKGRNYKAHAIARFIASGEWASHLSTLHHCDNPSCCNPAHLFAGTTADNMADRNRKGRQARGERQHSAKATAEQVRRIRAEREAGYTFAALAARHGISTGALQKIVRRQSWKHV